MKFMTILMMIGGEGPDDIKNLLATGCKIYNYITSIWWAFLKQNKMEKQVVEMYRT